jgi:hypothetical protein
MAETDTSTSWTRYLPEAFGIRQSIEDSPFRWCVRESAMWGVATGTAMGMWVDGWVMDAIDALLFKIAPVWLFFNMDLVDRCDFFVQYIVVLIYYCSLLSAGEAFGCCYFFVELI